MQKVSKIIYFVCLIAFIGLKSNAFATEFPDQGPWVDVRAYGAVPGAGIDNTKAINTALSTGRAVYIPAGIWGVSRLDFGSGSSIVGEGMGKTILKLLPGANTPIVMGKEYKQYAMVNSLSGVYGWSIKDLTIDGNKQANPQGDAGIKIYGYNFRIENVEVRNCRGGGIISEWTTLPNSPKIDLDFEDAYLSNVRVHDNDGPGIIWGGPHDSSWNSVVVYRNRGPYNVKVYSGGGPVYATNCHVWGNGVDYAWYLENRAMLSNCIGEGASIAQVYIGSSNTAIIGGEYFGAGSPNSKGLVFANGISGLNIYTQIRDCYGAAVDFGKGISSSNVSIINYQSHGRPRMGMLPTDSVISFVSTGVPGYSLVRLPSNLTAVDNLGVGTYAFGGGEHILGLYNAKAPTSGPVGGNYIYSENNIVKIHNPNGQKTLLSKSMREETVTGSIIDASDSCFIYLPQRNGHTTITDIKPAGQGQEVTILFGSGNITIQNNRRLVLSGNRDFTGKSDDTLNLIFTGSKWVEKSRSIK